MFKVERRASSPWPCSALVVDPTSRHFPPHNIELHGGSGATPPKSSGAFFVHFFKLQFPTNSCRHCSGVDLPLGSIRLDVYTTVGQGGRPHTQGWCQDQGAFFTHYPVSSLHAASGFVLCVACPLGSCSASCGATSPIKARVLWAPRTTALKTFAFHTLLGDHCIFTHVF